MNRKGDGFAIVFGAICLIVFSVISFFSIVGLHIVTTENGKHTGYVTAIETNGWIFKTDSVYFKTETESSQEDRYCIIDEEVKNKLEQYQKERKRVTIKFYDWMYRGIKNCKSDDIAIISGVEDES